MKTNKRKPVVGETLFDLNIGNAARHREQVLTEVEVLSVGRKYFICRPKGSENGWGEVEYNISDWHEVTNYCKDHCLYESRQAWEDEKESAAIAQKIRTAFSVYSSSTLPLSALRQIAAIIDAHAPAPTE